jgi:hypothetical protein
MKENEFNHEDEKSTKKIYLGTGDKKKGNRQ